MFEIYINVSVALSTFGSRSTIVNKDLVTIGMVERNSVLNKQYTARGKYQKVAPKYRS